MNVSRNQLRGTVRFVPSMGLTYFNNAKVACTSIKLGMWRRADEITGQRTLRQGVKAHSIDAGPWRGLLDCDRDMLAASVKFTVVRQPHTRLLSAYLNKRGKPPNDPFKRWCHHRIGGVPDTFPEFVRAILQVPEQDRDGHIRPQWINVLWPYVRFDFVGRMEEMAEVDRFLAGHGVKLKHYLPNVTNAAERVAEHCDVETRALIDEAYADDVKLWRGDLAPAEKTTIVDLF